MTKKKQTSVSSQNAKKVAAAKAEAARKKRNRIIIVIVGFIVIALIPVGAVLSQMDSTQQDPGNPDQTATDSPTTQSPTFNIPPNGTSAAGWISMSSPNVKHDAIIIDEHVDYQCGHCQVTDAIVGGHFQELVDRGDIIVRVHMRSFMDTNKGVFVSVPTGAAAACADVVGRYADYHEVAFKHAVEGTLTASPEQLRDQFPQEIGITGDDLTRFQTCVDNNEMLEYVEKMESTNLKSRTINGGDQDPPKGTPAFFANSNPFTMNQIVGEDEATQSYAPIYGSADDLLAFLRTVAN
ncbi:MAG: DsbA family protein [Propionibacteriaceae bacterium]|nr:DsbA family protein [Propionibacteriaceae bacterium]